MAERITSRANPLMAQIKRLTASLDRETGLYAGEGGKLLEEALRWGAAVETVVYVPGTALPPLPEGVRVVETTGEVLASVSAQKSPQGVLFVGRAPAMAAPERLEGRRYLALEGVQDPGNVGTILRTADAFGADGLLLLPGCAEPYGPKTLRSSMGAAFRLPFWRVSLEELSVLAQASSLPLIGAALRKDARDVRTLDLRRGIILIGSEGRGLSREALARCGAAVTIPMRRRCESLNAAVAAAVLLWQGFEP